MSKSVEKELIIIAGANGSGKTTFAIPYVEELEYDFLNADEIAKKLSSQGFDNPLIKAGRIFFTKLSEYIEQENSFVVETTLSGNYVKKIAKKAKLKGYKVQVIYIFLESEELCVERVKARVIKGGHNVPEEDIKRRYFRSKENFWEHFTVLANSWILLQNGINGFQSVAIGQEDDYSIENELLFKLFKSIEK